MILKCLKLYSETTRLRIEFHLSFEHFDILSIVYKSLERGIELVYSQNCARVFLGLLPNVTLFPYNLMLQNASYIF